ncbi:MAG TPA: S8 family serine peptidase, partial [Candidatus Eisenbacteria bacterium]|nr:S8 family serine peptidase [Candidatus Eisenbacteria bacterium]
MIDQRFTPQESVDVIVDFNRYLPPSDMRGLLDAFGTVTYIAKLVTCALVDDVRVSRLDSLARHPDVALIEMQTMYQPTTDISTRSVQARASESYSTSAGAGSAEDMGARGNGINIALLDTGVQNSHAAFSGKALVGFDATIFEDTNGNEIDDSCEAAGSTCTGASDENGNGTGRDPEPASSPSHGTHMAGVALGISTTGTCRNPPAPDDKLTGGCAGVAPEAGLVDVKVCPSETSCPPEEVIEGLDWVGLNASRLGIQVANVSIADCFDDDGTTAAPQTVNALVSRGVAVAVGHGNAGACTDAAGVKEPSGTVRTAAPGSASLAVTVSGADDSDTVKRTDDVNYANYLKGPRKDYATTSDVRALKPDLCAPAAGVKSATDLPDVYFLDSGTSVASAHVAGAAAVIRGLKPSIDPGSLKDLLLRSVDRTLTIFPSGKTWDEALGNGEMNLYGALSATAVTDVGFTSCTGPPSAPGKPCYLSSTVPSWNNYMDIETATPPEDGIPNTLYASVTNNGAAATVVVDFGVYVFGVGNTEFHHLGSTEVSLGAGET